MPINEIRKLVDRDLEQLGIEPRRYSFDTPLLKRVQGLARVRRDAEAELQNLPPGRADAIRVQMTDALREDLAAMIAEERTRLQGELEKERTRLAREDQVRRPEVDREIANYDRKARAMSAAELKAEAARAISGEIRLRPEQLDALSIELRNLDPKYHETFRDTIRAEHLEERERFTDVGSRIVKMLDGLTHAERSGWTLPIQDSNGNIMEDTLDEIMEASLEN